MQGGYPNGFNGQQQGQYPGPGYQQGYGQAPPQQGYGQRPQYS